MNLPTIHAAGSVPAASVEAGRLTSERSLTEFLRHDPRAPLLICSAYASASGLVWLSARCRRRPVRLVTGSLPEEPEMRGGNTSREWDAAKRTEAALFLKRSDVEVRLHGIRGGGKRPLMHLKVWAECGTGWQPRRFLIGSANLTISGVNRHIETMSEPAASEAKHLAALVSHVYDAAVDAKEDWLKLLGVSGAQGRLGLG